MTLKISQKVRQVTLEESIDNSISKVKSIKNNGIKTEADIFVLDLCLQYVILMSEVRTGE